MRRSCCGRVQLANLVIDAAKPPEERRTVPTMREIRSTIDSSIVKDIDTRQQQQFPRQVFARGARLVSRSGVSRGLGDESAEFVTVSGNRRRSRRAGREPSVRVPPLRLALIRGSTRE